MATIKAAKIEYSLPSGKQVESVYIDIEYAFKVIQNLNNNEVKFKASYIDYEIEDEY
jgi:hypothetical protein